MKKTFTVRILGLALGINLILVGAAFAATDNVDNQTLVNTGALTVSYTPTEQFIGSYDTSPSQGPQSSIFINFSSGVDFTNTTGNSSPFTLSWNSENLQGSTGVAAASTGFNYTEDIEVVPDTDNTVAYDAGSIGTGNVAFSATGLPFYKFEGSGASGTTSSDFDILTGCGTAFSLQGTIVPSVTIYYRNQLPGLYTGAMTFTII